MLNSASPPVLGWLRPNQHFSNALLEVPDGVHSKCADNKILVSENLTTLTTTSHIETFPFCKIMTAMDGIFLVGPKAKPLSGIATPPPSMLSTCPWESAT